MYKEEQPSGPSNNQNINWTSRDFSVIDQIFSEFNDKPIVFKPQVKLLRTGYSYYGTDNYIFTQLLNNNDYD